MIQKIQFDIRNGNREKIGEILEKIRKIDFRWIFHYFFPYFQDFDFPLFSPLFCVFSYKGSFYRWFASILIIFKVHDLIWSENPRSWNIISWGPRADTVLFYKKTTVELLFGCSYKGGCWRLFAKTFFLKTDVFWQIRNIGTENNRLKLVLT